MSRVAPVRAGDVIQVAEPDYCYGVGSITLRITTVHYLVYLDDGPWVVVDGIPLWPNGYEGEERYAQIRVTGIQHLPGGPASRTTS
ncbi:hypothetical protein [Couchioplanes caeruleus]|uniref:Uncharacterized protein n=2 Tax=Couchioplanes caeruleus TaxID=56438 RepID=A0A1K0FD16_9ACTN|nr:hypothetical protein [Couchioplanes caeruleus]OJF10735.1 hypothetical protein BG844_30190 [Couchioplanes caeruleus subsp. caeruleus]ROP28168.1 hypothetical protein EDD30_0878 [Couchioplanes caeruleus]